MLARYLAQHRRPVRYAMDPAHAEAMRNFLALHTRAYDLPRLAHIAAPHLQHPLLQQLLQAVLGEHDTGAIGPLLDVHQDEMGIQAFPRLGPNVGPSHDASHAQRSLMDHIMALHLLMSGDRPHVPGMGYSMSPEEIHARYATQALRGLQPGAAGRVDTNSFLATSSPSTRQFLTHAAQQGPSEPLLLIPAYDWLHRFITHPGSGHIIARGQAGQIRGNIANALRQGIIPHLHEGL